jgi:peroxiredoxin
MCNLNLVESCAKYLKQHHLLQVVCTIFTEQPAPITVHNTTRTTTLSKYCKQNFQNNYSLQLLSTKLSVQLPSQSTAHRTSNTTTLSKYCTQNFQYNYPLQLLCTTLSARYILHTEGFPAVLLHAEKETSETVLYNCVLPGYWPVRPKTLGSFCFII